MGTEELDTTIEELQWLARRWDKVQSFNTSIVNGIKAVIRDSLNWDPMADEKSRKEVKDAASDIFDCFMKKDPEAPEYVSAVQDCVASEYASAVQDCQGFVKMWMPSLQRSRELQETYGKAMAEKARTLPVWSWADNVKGLAAKGLGKIIGETGNLGRFDGRRALRKYCGLAPPDEQGDRYSRRRQSVLLGQQAPALIKQKSHYYEVYSEEKTRRKEKNEAGDYAGKAKAIAADWKAKGKTDSQSYKKYANGFLPNGHIHSQAIRYMMQQFLNDLLEQWGGANGL